MSEPTCNCGDPSCDGGCGYPPSERQGASHRPVRGFGGILPAAQPTNMTPYLDDLNNPGLDILQTLMTSLTHQSRAPDIAGAADTSPS